MRIIVKFLLRNIKEKKLRTVLILFSIIMSTALLFSTLAISGTIEKLLVDELKRYSGSSEIQIQADTQDSMDPFFSMKENHDDKIDYLVGMIRGTALYDDEKDDKLPVVLMGYQYDDLMKIFDIDIKEQDNTSFIGNKAIISMGAADANNLTLGSEFEIEIRGIQHTFRVASIANTKGLFNYNGLSMTVVVPRETLANIYNSPDKVTNIQVKTHDSRDVRDVMTSLSDDYDDLIVKTTYSKEQLAENIGAITAPFSIMLVLVAFISIFIIYTSFKVITYERLPMVGTFRSIGATKKITDWILLGESIIYGVIGGILGCFLGVGILRIMMNSIAYNPYTGVTSKVEMVMNIDQLIIALLFAVILSIISALIPIIRVSKMPVRNIVLNNIRRVTNKGYLKTILGIVFVLIPIIILQVKTIKPSLLLGALSVLLIAVALVLLVPVITNVIIRLFEKVISFIFGNVGTLAVKNIRNNKDIINNIILLAMGIASILMINTVGQSMSKELIKAYSDAKYQIVFYHPKADDKVVEKLEGISGVKSANGFYGLRDVKVKEKNDYVTFVWGIESDQFFKYWQFDIMGDKEKILNEFNTGRNIIASNVLKGKFDLEIGDYLTLNLKENHKKYKIIGFTNSLMNNGDLFLIPKSYMKDDTGLNYLESILIKTSEDEEVVSEKIKQAFNDQYIQLISMKEQEQNNMESNNQVFTLLQGFSFLTMIIGVFGIFNNFVVSLISRKQSIAIYRSVGMDRKQVLKMLFVESITSGAIGGIIGMLGALLFIMLGSYIMEAIILPMPMHPSLGLFINAFISGILISVIAAIIPTLRTSKLSIIDSIKYE